MIRGTFRTFGAKRPSANTREIATIRLKLGSSGKFRLQVHADFALRDFKRYNLGAAPHHQDVGTRPAGVGHCDQLVYRGQLDAIIAEQDVTGSEADPFRSGAGPDFRDRDEIRLPAGMQRDPLRHRLSRPRYWPCPPA